MGKSLEVQPSNEKDTKVTYINFNSVCENDEWVYCQQPTPYLISHL